MVSPRVARRPPIWVGGNSRAAVRRAARLGDGWIPWELTPEDFAASAAYAGRVRGETARSSPFALVAPLGVAPDAGAEALLEAAARWRQAGATAFHVGVGARSFAEFLERLAWVAGEVMARVT
jgi:alkanesulfonate monooxygenase SsuD/methylene tetrahydromethanopterin reductase-like flavin-dependent oxidoreductase (luciferase family)